MLSQPTSVSVWTAEECGVQTPRDQSNNFLYETVTRSEQLRGGET